MDHSLDIRPWPLFGEALEETLSSLHLILPGILVTAFLLELVAPMTDAPVLAGAGLFFLNHGLFVAAVSHKRGLRNDRIGTVFLDGCQDHFFAMGALGLLSALVLGALAAPLVVLMPEWMEFTVSILVTLVLPVLAVGLVLLRTWPQLVGAWAFHDTRGWNGLGIRDTWRMTGGKVSRACANLPLAAACALGGILPLALIWQDFVGEIPRSMLKGWLYLVALPYLTNLVFTFSMAVWRAQGGAVAQIREHGDEEVDNDIIVVLLDEVAQEMATEIPEEILEEISGEISADISEEISAEIAERISKEILGGATAEHHRQPSFARSGKPSSATASRKSSPPAPLPSVGTSDPLAPALDLSNTRLVVRFDGSRLDLHVDTQERCDLWMEQPPTTERTWIDLVFERLVLLPMNETSRPDKLPHLIFPLLERHGLVPEDDAPDAWTELLHLGEGMGTFRGVGRLDSLRFALTAEGWETIEEALDVLRDVPGQWLVVRLEDVRGSATGDRAQRI